jgi:hypothetical protein
MNRTVDNILQAARAAIVKVDKMLPERTGPKAEVKEEAFQEEKQADR